MIGANDAIILLPLTNILKMNEWRTYEVNDIVIYKIDPLPPLISLLGFSLVISRKKKGTIFLRVVLSFDFKALIHSLEMCCLWVTWVFFDP